MAKKIPVDIEYERQVVNTAEGITLAAILSDLAQLTSDEDFGRNFRNVYGSDSEREVEDLRRGVQMISRQYGAAILVSTSGRTSNTIPGELVTPSFIAGELNARPDAFPKPGGGEWHGDDFVEPFADGAERAFRLRTGSVLQTITTEEIDAVERVSEIAASLGLRLEDVETSDLPSFRTGREGDVTAVKVIAHYVALVRRDASVLGRTGDWLRFNAPRPGGINLSGTRSLDPEQIALSKMAGALTNVNPRDYQDMLANEAQRHGLTLDRYLRDPRAANTREDNFAVLRVIRGFQPGIGDPFGTGEAFKILFQTNRFLLERASEQQMERTSFVETFGETYLYLFGTKAKIWEYSGVLMDTQGQDWLNAWRSAYEKYVKASASTKLKARCFLIYDNVVREGVIVATGIGRNVGQYGFARFNFRMFVINEYLLSGQPDPTLPSDLPTVFDIQEKAKNREERYEISGPVDTTPRLALVPATRNERAARQIEELIFRRERDALEQDILADAFPGGRLARTSGTVARDLSDAVIRDAVQQIVEISQEAETFTPPPSIRSGTLSAGPSHGAFAIP